MREFPVFIPHGTERLAAIITIPDGAPRGLILLLTGTGAPRSHRFQLFTRIARALADDGLASLRLDYKGIGDSTGRTPQSSFGDLPVDEAMSAVDFAMRAVGVDRLGLVGNCTGSLVALSLAASLPRCEVAVCILPRVLDPNPVNRMVIAARGSKLAGWVRSTSFLRSWTSPLRGRKGRPSRTVRESLAPALDHARVLFLYSKQDTDSYNEKSIDVLRRFVVQQPPEKQARLEVRVLEDGPLSGFESLAVQQVVIDTVVDAVGGSFLEVAPAGLSSAARQSDP